MSEGGQGTGLPGAAAPVPLSAGMRLRRMRESAGVSLSLLASTLKVSEFKLHALEQDDYGALPGLTFARGLAASICRAFDEDANAVLALMPMVDHSGMALAQNINVPFHGPGDRAGGILSPAWRQKIIGAVAVLVLLAAALWFWPTEPVQEAVEDDFVPGLMGAEGSADDAIAEGMTPRSDPVGSTDVLRGELLGESSDLQAQDAVETTLGLGVEPDSSEEESLDMFAANRDGELGSESAMESAATAVEDEPLVSSESADGATEPEQPAPLAISASAESWVTVRDASGQSLLNRALQGGEEIVLDGELPLAVTIGRKNAVRVSVHGEPFALESSSGSSVARFEVN